MLLKIVAISAKKLPTTGESGKPIDLDHLERFGLLERATKTTRSSFEDGPLHYKSCVVENCSDFLPKVPEAVRQYVENLKGRKDPSIFISLPELVLKNIFLFRYEKPESQKLERIFYAFHQIIEVLAGPVFMGLIQLKNLTNLVRFGTIIDKLVKALDDINLVMSEFNQYMVGDNFDKKVRAKLLRASGSQSPFRFVSKALYGEYTFLEPEFTKFVSQFNLLALRELVMRANLKKIDSGMIDFLLENFKAECEKLGVMSDDKSILETHIKKANRYLASVSRLRDHYPALAELLSNISLVKDYSSNSESVAELVSRLLLFRLKHVHIVRKQIPKAYEANQKGTGGSSLRSFLWLSVFYDLYQLKRLLIDAKSKASVY